MRLKIVLNVFYFGGQQASGGSFDVKIFAPNSSKPVWRGLLKASTNGFGNISAEGKSRAERIAEKLIQDGVI